jgi:FlaA1/EpsC-like NDP-sugar epimerase
VKARIFFTLALLAGLMALRVWLGHELYLQVVTTLSALLFWTFVIRYGVKSPWWKHPVGRSIMWLALSLAVVLTLVCTSFIFGEYPGRETVRTVIYSTLPLAAIEFVRALVQAQRTEIPPRQETH